MKLTLLRSRNTWLGTKHALFLNCKNAMQIIKKTKINYSARNIRSVHKKYSQATATIWLLYDRSNRIEQKRFTPRWTKITASQFSKGYAIWSMIDVSQPWPWKAESKLATLNRVGQGLGVHCIQGDFKSSMRYFDAKIGSLMAIKYTCFLLFPNFGISHELKGKFWVQFVYQFSHGRPWPKLHHIDIHRIIAKLG